MTISFSIAPDYFGDVRNIIIGGEGSEQSMGSDTIDPVRTINGVAINGVCNQWGRTRSIL